jgi:hypothetical protein
VNWSGRSAGSAGQGKGHAGGGSIRRGLEANAAAVTAMTTMTSREDPLAARRQRQARFARAKVRAAGGGGGGNGESLRDIHRWPLRANVGHCHALLGRFAPESLDLDDEEEVEGRPDCRSPAQAVTDSLRVLVTTGGEGASKSRRLARLNGLVRLWEAAACGQHKQANDDHGQRESLTSNGGHHHQNSHHELMQAELKLNVMLW